MANMLHERGADYIRPLPGRDYDHVGDDGMLFYQTYRAGSANAPP
jgi:hypothetical protein